MIWRQFALGSVLSIVFFLPMAQANPVKVLPIEIKTPVGEVACSSTLLRIENSCHLLTDAHCLTGGLRSAAAAASASVRLHLPVDLPNPVGLFTQIFLAAFSDPVVEVRTMRVHRPYDLAELEIPSKLLKTCEDLPNLDVVPAKGWLYGAMRGDATLQSIAAYGYVKHEAKTTFSQDFDHNDYAHSPLHILVESNDPDANLIEADRLHIIPGMSGGAATIKPDLMMGLIARYVPFQRRGFIIPIESIAHWLAKDPRTDLQDLALNAAVTNDSKDTLYLSNNQQLSGDNSGKPTVGDNEHAGGGGNWTDSRFATQEPLSVFREPHEGIQVTEGSSSGLLLGVINKKPVQIDGWDDYHTKAASNSLPRVYLENSGPDKGFPNSKIRSKLLQRLAGYYRDEMDDGLHFRYLQDFSEVEGYKLDREGESHVSIDLNPKAKLKNPLTGPNGKKIKTIPMLAVYFHSHWIRTPGDFTYLTPMSDDSLKFWIKPDAEWKKIQLVPFTDDGSLGQALECKNDNYLKLICISPTLEISLSLSGIEYQEMSYRVSLLGNAGQTPVVDYWFGRTIGALRPDKFRDAP